MRTFIDAVRVALRRGKGKYVGAARPGYRWATEQAAPLDPLVASPPSILDEKAKYPPWLRLAAEDANTNGGAASRTRSDV
jgi:hypothetical protein